MRVRGLQVLDDGAELLALTVGEDARDLDVESVAREAVGGAEHPVDAQQRLAEVERVGVEGRDGRDVDAEEEADRVLDALGRALLPVHLDEHRREAPLAHRVELERERVAEVAQDEVDEGLGRALEVEDIGPAIDVGEQEVRHLLQARDEPEQVAGVVVASVVLRQHAPQIEAAPLRARGTEAGEGGAVVGAEDCVAEEIRHADGHDLVKHVGRHLGVECEEDDAAIDAHTSDRDRDCWRAPGRDGERCPARDQHRLVERDAHGLLRERLRADDAGCGPVLDDERVHLVERGRAAHGLSEHAHVDRGQARERSHRMQHDAQRVGGLRDAGQRTREGRGELGHGAAVERKDAVDPHARGRALHAVRPGVDQLEGERRVDGHAALAGARVTVHEHEPRRRHHERHRVDVERGQLNGAHAVLLTRSPARAARRWCAGPRASRRSRRGR